MSHVPDPRAIRDALERAIVRARTRIRARKDARAYERARARTLALMRELGLSEPRAFSVWLYVQEQSALECIDALERRLAERRSRA